MLIIRNWIAVLLSLCRLLSGLPAAAASEGAELRAASAVLMHSSGAVIYEKNADRRSLIASTTKLMTALVILRSEDPGRTVEIPAECCGLEGSSMYLAPGQSRSVYELLEGLLLASGNDAALALAIAAAGTEEAFVERMNETAEELGLSDTRFANPHGLDAKGHYSTARDLAKLMLRCMEEPVFAEITALRSVTLGENTFENHNRLLTICPGCIGGKTGYTMAAGRCLVSCCERDGMRFVCVTLNDPDDWEEHCKLYDYAFSAFTERNVTEGLRFEVPLVSGERERAAVEPEPLCLFLPKNREIRLEAELPWFEFAPVLAGEKAGVLRAYDGETELGSVSIRYAESVPLLLKKRE